MDSQKIKVGDAVIMNYHDRPCTRLVAIVHSIRDNFVYAYYLTRNNRIGLHECADRYENVTLLKDFGVELVIADELATCTLIRESTAKYKDGSIRQWQPDGNEYLEVFDYPLYLWMSSNKKE